MASKIWILLAIATVADVTFSTNDLYKATNIIERGSDKSRKMKWSDILDNSFGDHDLTKLGNLREYFETMYHEWELLIELQDAEKIAEKYTEDCLHVYKEGNVTKILEGREELQKSYEAWFESGVARLDVQPLYEGYLGAGFLYLVDHIVFYNGEDEIMGAITDLVVFKHQGEGYAVHLTAELHD